MKVQIYRDELSLGMAAAELFVKSFHEVTQKHEVFTLCLSGGHGPRRMFEILATQKFQSQINWGQVQVFWSDERFVPPNHPDSNYGMAERLLLSHVPIPPENIHRFRTELLNSTKIVQDYERQLQEVFRYESSGDGSFFDLVYLGLGENGHTASLFPDVDLSQHAGEKVFAIWVPHLDAYRFTLGFDVFNRSRCDVFLVAGEKKAKILKEVLEPQGEIRYPAQAIHPKNGHVLWLVDQQAAKDLSPLKLAG